MNIDFKITELLTLPAAIMTAISIASGILLFSPIAFLDKLFMLGFREKYGFIIGLIFLLSVSILIVNLIIQTFKTISKNKIQKEFYATAEKRLRKLSTYQKTIVYELFKQDDRTLVLPIHNGAVKELEQNLVIGKAASNYFVEDLNNASIPYHLQPWVSGELNSKPELLYDFKEACKIQYDKENSF
ncbi:superinfection exclusion B family protein [Bacillus atrophaeus]|uniref:superinfection exclusion B family protein n=1 Tax=Bacillus atrophaeus TaxID=1452 RepID=UPI0022819B23|nr:superinfection exclusion B family protein [Bacillus atrophaeus]MCY8513806.1 superinfection exclusion B family protein [Bacillus atrophaeus]MCY8837664.1 superinfection exclusion B family protein [Bacillus atrophaeus]MCY8990650.1 superinfection exclusion B family protein [Bacillus atrophaeus]